MGSKGREAMMVDGGWWVMKHEKTYVNRKEVLLEVWGRREYKRNKETII